MTRLPTTVDDHDEVAMMEAANSAGKYGNNNHNANVTRRVTCPICLLTLPLTKSHWIFNDNGRPEGPCRTCQREGKSVLPSTAVASQGTTMTTLSQIIKGELVQSSDIEHLWDKVRNRFGDEEGIACLLQEVFLAAKPGSNTQVSVLKLVINLCSQASDKRGNDSGKTMDMMTNDDLFNVAKQMLNGGLEAADGITAG